MKGKPIEKKIKDNFNLFRSLLIISLSFSKFTLNLLKEERDLVKNTRERIRIIILAGRIKNKIIKTKNDSDSVSIKEWKRINDTKPVISKTIYAIFDLSNFFVFEIVAPPTK